MAETKYQLLPRLEVAVMGNAFYIYDSNCHTENIVHIRPQQVSERFFNVISAMKNNNPKAEAKSIEAWRELLADIPGGQEVWNKLQKAGYVEPYMEEGPEEALHKQLKESSEPATAEQIRQDLLQYRQSFEGKGKPHYFKPPSFFNLPTNILDDRIDVGMLGVPFTSTPVSTETRFAPNSLRYLSQIGPPWFKIYESGKYSDALCGDDYPEILGKDVVLKDYGDIDETLPTVGSLYDAVKAFFEDRVVPLSLKMLFIGGDHAVTAPIVTAYKQRLPNLCLIHLDAHNDLFYCLPLEFNHAAPIGHLLLLEELSQIYSFGLRTSGDHRTDVLNRVKQSPEHAQRLHFFGLGPTQRLIAQPKHLEEVFAQIAPGTPCYLTIDIDVLSADEINNNTSTPAGAGLSWNEIFSFIDVAFKRLEIVAADLVEYNTARGSGPPPEAMTDFIVFLVDRLAKSASPKWSKQVAEIE